MPKKFDGEKRIAKEIVKFTHLLYEQGYSVCSEGNISFRMSKNRVLITPSNMIKKFIRRKDIVEIDMNGKLVKGTRRPTTERFTHLEIYRRNPEVHAIVHAHPLYTVLASVLKRNPFEKPFVSESAMFLRDVQFADFALPSTEEGAKVVTDICKKSRIVVIDRHGSFTYGHNLSEAFSLLEIMEKVAKLDFLARLDGGRINFLEKAQIEALLGVEYGK